MKKSEKLISTAVNWYVDNMPLYQEFTQKVNGVIQEIILISQVNIHAVFSRTKAIESFTKKIEKGKYTHPCSQITDLSAIRIVVGVENDLSKICKLIESFFEIDYNNSLDKTKLLGTDKVGYRSIHYVAKLPSRLTILPECHKFVNLRFEIQIRTLLQHAWAEIEHDRNYKYLGKLPEDLTRRLKVLAGVLELADREFNIIASDVAKIELMTKKMENLSIQNQTSNFKFNFN